MHQLDTRTACALGVACLIALIIILFNGKDDGPSNPGDGWK